METERRPGEIVWVHNDMARVTIGAPYRDGHWITPSSRAPQSFSPSKVGRIRSWAITNPAPDPERCYCITPCFHVPANERLCPKERECPPTCSGHGYALHDTIILLSGKTRQDAMLSLINANHPHRVAHMIPESDMFDAPDSMDASEHYRHMFRTVAPGPDRHCVCCHIGHAMTWYQCDCGANACSYCTVAGADGHLHGLTFN